jgi:hypothetical protein
MLALDTPANISIRDSNSLTQANKIFVPVTPWQTSASIVDIAPSIQLYVWHDENSTQSPVWPGQPDVAFMPISFYNPAFAGSADLQINGVTITSVDSGGTVMNMSSLLDQIEIINFSGSTVYLALKSLSFFRGDWPI